MSSMTPQEIVSELDRHIVGECGAKRCEGGALRNCWRRRGVDAGLCQCVTPMCGLMICRTV